MRSEEMDDRVGTWVGMGEEGVGLVIGRGVGALIVTPATPTTLAWGRMRHMDPMGLSEAPTPDPVPEHLADLWAAFEARRRLAEEAPCQVEVRVNRGMPSEAEIEAASRAVRGALKAPAPMMATDLPPDAIEAGTIDGAPVPVEGQSAAEWIRLVVEAARKQGAAAASVDDDGCELSSYRDMIHRIDAALECQTEALAQRGFKINGDSTTEAQVVKLVFWAAEQPILADVRVGVLRAVGPVVRACAEALELVGIVHADTGCAVAYAARKWMREAHETASKGGDLPKYWSRW